MKSRIMFTGVLVLAVIFALTSLGFAGEEDKIVIHHTAAFGGELKLLKELMTETYGEPEVVNGELGRVYYVWETGPKTRLVASITLVGMQNATLSPALIMLTLPEELQPDLVTHGGICGGVLEGSKPMDVYAPYAVVFCTLGLYGPSGPAEFSPFGMDTWNPETGALLDGDHEPIWVATDPVLTQLVAAGFNDAVEDSGFKELWAARSGLSYTPTLILDTVQESSNYFASNDEIQFIWANTFEIEPDMEVNRLWGDYDRRVHKVGGVDMETAAVVWTFKQFGVPTAVLRYVSDVAGRESSEQIKQFSQTASAVGGYAFFYGLQNVISAIEEGRLTVENGQCVLGVGAGSGS